MILGLHESATDRCLLVVHGHRQGTAVGGRVEISQEAAARVRRAEQVARRRRIDKVLFCRAGAPGHTSEARQMAALWRGTAIQALLDERSTDSAENAAEALWWAHCLGVRTLTVVAHPAAVLLPQDAQHQGSPREVLALATAAASTMSRAALPAPSDALT